MTEKHFQVVEIKFHLTMKFAFSGMITPINMASRNGHGLVGSALVNKHEFKTLARNL